MDASFSCFSFSWAITLASSSWAPFNLNTNQSISNQTSNYIRVVILFSFWFHGTEDLGIEVQCPHPQTHGLAGSRSLLHSLWHKLWILNVFLELLQHQLWNLVLNSALNDFIHIRSTTLSSLRQWREWKWSASSRVKPRPRPVTKHRDSTLRLGSQ